MAEDNESRRTGALQGTPTTSPLVSSVENTSRTEMNNLASPVDVLDHLAEPWDHRRTSLAFAGRLGTIYSEMREGRHLLMLPGPRF